MKTLSLLLVLVVSPFCHAGDYNSQIDAFFAVLGKRNNSEAVDSLFSTNPGIAKNNPAGIQDVKSALDAQAIKYGKIESWKKVGEYVVGDYYAYVTYYVGYEYQPLWMEFQFFKSKDGWRISMFNFSSDIREEIQQRARYEVSKKTEPNKALVPTATAVTPAADAPVAPAAAAAHL